MVKTDKAAIVINITRCHVSNAAITSTLCLIFTELNYAGKVKYWVLETYIFIPFSRMPFHKTLPPSGCFQVQYCHSMPRLIGFWCHFAPMPGAELIDTSHLTADEVFARAQRLVDNRLKSEGLRPENSHPN